MASSGSISKAIPRVVACAFFMQLLDSSVITTSLPQMAASFGTLPTRLSLGITAYLLTASALVPLSGWLVDRYGARNVFASAIGLFTIASLACGLANSLTLFVIARIIQGVGGALMAPVGRIVVLRNSSKSELFNAMQTITFPALIAPVIGPVIGGFITSYVSWRWNFLLNIPPGIIGAAFVLVYIPDHREATRHPLDWRGLLLSSFALTSLLYGLELFARRDSDWLFPTSLLITGLIVGLLAIRYLTRRRHPLIDLTAFHVPTFSNTVGLPGTLYRTSIAAGPFLLPLMFQLGFGLSPWVSGLLILADSIGNLIIKGLTKFVLRRWSHRTVLFSNGCIGGVALLACGFLTPHTSIVLVVVVLMAGGATRSMQFTSLLSLTFADIPADQQSSASSLYSMMQQMSLCLGVAFAAILLTVGEKWHGDASVQMADFRFAFIGVSLLAFLSAAPFLNLSTEAGDDVSGHRSKSRRLPAD